MPAFLILYLAINHLLLYSESKESSCFLKKTKTLWISFHLPTFQGEDAVAQGVHDVVERGLVRHVEEVLVVGVAGDVFDLGDERLGVLLPSDVVTEDLEGSVGEKRRELERKSSGWGWCNWGRGGGDAETCRVFVAIAFPAAKDKTETGVICR